MSRTSRGLAPVWPVSNRDTFDVEHSMWSATALADLTKISGAINSALMTFQVSPADDGQNLR